MSQAKRGVCTAVYDEELVVVQLQNELAKLEVDILHTQSHNLRLDQTLKLLDQDMNEKMQTISKYEVQQNTCTYNICGTDADLCLSLYSISGSDADLYLLPLIAGHRGICSSWGGPHLTVKDKTDTVPILLHGPSGPLVCDVPL